MKRLAIVLGLALPLAACTSELPRGTSSFTLGRTTVRVDSTLDLVGLVLRLSDTADIPPLGPIKKWAVALGTEVDDSAFDLARSLGPTPVGPVLEAWAAPATPDSACGWIAPGVRRCFTGNAPQRRALARFIGAARAFAPRAAPLTFEGLNAAARLRDLSDVYVALAGSKAPDSLLAAYSGYAGESYDVTLARTFWTRQLSPTVDPVGWTHELGNRIFIAPDPVFADRSFRSPSYIWLAAGHQMAHAVVRRLFAEHPEILERTVQLRPTIEAAMARAGYAPIFWDETLGEQLARAITIRALLAAKPTLAWPLRTEAMGANMALVPWLEDALVRYERDRATYPNLSAFAGELTRAIAAIPLDSCRAATSPDVALVGVGRERAIVGWIGEKSPFKGRGLLAGDTVLAVDGDSVSAGDLMLPTRQLYLDFSQHLPAELATLSIRRGGRIYGIEVPINWAPRAVTRVASQARTAVEPICGWVQRAVRQ
ncbi:MAG TPA: DUF4932 domain-containing protein [Gemmatimonadales bacterium]|nr:DUF4932 domain-containing protein [Gemmatimonadales bacterium]